MADSQGRSDLHHSASGGTAGEAKRLIESGEDPNLQDNEGFAPLHFAAQQQNVEVARVLLEHGAVVDAVNKFGNTPLFVAVFNSRGDGRMIVLLRSAGADPFKANAHGHSPVSLARKIANYDVAQFFRDLD